MPRSPFSAPEPQDSLQDVVSGIVIFFAIFVAGLMVGRTPEYLGKKIQAAEMLAIGYLTEMVPVTELDARVDALAERLAAMENAVDALKQAIAEELKTRRKAK